MKDDVVFERVKCWDPRVVEAIRDHYPKSRGPPPGKKITHLAVYRGDVIAVLGLGEPAFKLAPRRVVGIQDARPLPETVCCFIYRRLTPSGPHGSEILKGWHDSVSLAWFIQYGWDPLHWETMVLPSAVDSSVPGACFRRAGYRPLGFTTGASARRPSGNTKGPRVWSRGDPKLVLYRGPLHRVSAPLASP